MNIRPAGLSPAGVESTAVMGATTSVEVALVKGSTTMPETGSRA